MNHARILRRLIYIFSNVFVVFLRDQQSSTQVKRNQKFQETCPIPPSLLYMIRFLRLMSNHFFGEESFTNGNLLYLSVICLPLQSRAYTIKASQKFNDLISILSKLTKPFTFPYTVSNVYRPFVKSGRSPFIILIGCQTD